MQQWAYTTHLNIGDGDEHILQLDKVGTIADIYFNGTLILQVDNLFLSYHVPLPSGSGNLTIEIKSTVRDSYIRAAKYNKDVTKVETPWKSVWVSPNWI